MQHVILRHAGGALSSLVTGQAIQRYRRPALEIYGTEGTANLLGDDWDSTGYELWRNSAAYWESHDSLDPTWLWCDGLRELVACLRERRAPLASSSHDLHLLDVIAASRVASRERRAVAVESGFDAARPPRSRRRASFTIGTTTRARPTSSKNWFQESLCSTLETVYARLKRLGGVCSLPLHVVGISFT